MKQKASVIITDLDNTLYDWVEMWYHSFSAMLDHLVLESNIERRVLEAEIRTVFQKYGTSEYAFVIQDLPSLRAQHPGEDLVARYQTAIEAYRKARSATLRLYPTVLETLKELRNERCLIVAFTESMAYYTMRRVQRLGLDGLLDYLYSPPNHDLPPDVSREELRSDPAERYELRHTKHCIIRKGERKPNPAILREIINRVGASVDQTVYIGDSLMKDIAMAQDASVTDVHAKYGTAQHTEAYELLRRVTHWTKEDVEREKNILKRGTVRPTYVLENSFSELLDLFEFIPHGRH